MFYNKEIELLTQTEGYVDSKGICHDGEDIVLKKIMADVQPYSSERLYREYGYNVKCVKRVFCDLDNKIVEGMKIKYQNNFYIINKIIEWDDYLDIMIDNWK